VEAPPGASRRWAQAVRWLALAFAVGGFAASDALAATLVPPPSLVDCNAPGFDRILVAPPADAPGSEARAYWLSRGLVAWPGARGPGRYVLYASRDGQLRLRTDGRLQGADARIELAVAGAIPAAVQARFRFVGDGPRLALPADAVARLPRLLEGELLLTREERGRIVASTRLQLPGALDDLYAADAADPASLGATVSAAAPGVGFSVWAPTARAVSVCRYAGDTTEATAITPMARAAGSGTWRARDGAAAAGSYYLYLADVYVPGVGLVRNRVSDPWATGVGADSHRSQALDLDAPALAPAGWSADRAPDTVRDNVDMAIYELHVRDFSVGDASVPAAHRGKYLAFTDRDARGMRHLRALADAGLTDVHLLPVFDFATVPETACVTPSLAGAPDGETQQAAAAAVASRDCFNWGYDPVHYSAPEGSYASDAHDGAVRVREFRAMVQALHAAGLRVGMDVVYNHLTASGQRENALLDRLVPGYYHRLDDKGVVARSTCCDNTATEHAMMARLMLDSVSLWARAYHVDSFRFDLMGHQTRAAMEALRDRLLAETKRTPNLIGEGWNFGEVADSARFVQASQLSLNGSGIGSFSDRGRDAARGGSAGDSGAAMLDNQGWLNGLVYAPNGHGPARKPEDLLRAADMVRVGLAGTLRGVRMQTYAGDTKALADIPYGNQPAGFASAPSEVVNYVENHDNHTLFDIDALRLPRATSAADRARVQVLGMALTAFSQGVAYFHAGIDVLRSKSLDRNSFDSGDGFNRLDWTYTDNGFGHGLPPKQDNGKDWALLRPLLADASIKPAPADIAFARDAFRDLLRIRASTPLFRLRDAAEVGKRLRFPNSGPAQDPVMVAGLLDGRGRGDAVFDEVLYFVNASPEAQVLVLPELADRGYVLHPVLAAPGAADRARLAQARYTRASGRFDIPPRTALVYVLPRPASTQVPAR
jgi:pullulanase/glycogen debranching enzyme